MTSDHPPAGLLAVPLLRVSPVLVLGMLLAVSLNALATAYKEGPKIGDAPPPFKLGKVLQGPSVAEVTWEKLRGKVVVLEFWTTSCAPCVRAIPHLNDLADQFKNRPVQFISVTTENVAVVKLFLEKHPIKAWIGFDEFEELRQAFAVAGIPHTVIVDTNGKIAAITHPAKLEAKHLEEILAGQLCSLPPLKLYEDDFTETETVPAARMPLFEITIRPAGRTMTERGAFCSWSHAPDRCEYTGEIATLESALSAVFNKTQPYMFIEGELPVGFFDFHLKVPSSQPERLKQQFIEALRTTFGLDVRLKLRSMEIYRLTVDTTNAPGLRPATKEGGGGGIAGGFDLRGSPMATVVQFLDPPLGQPVIDETGLQGLFTVHLKWEMSEAELLLRRVDYKVVEALEKNPTQKTLESLSPRLVKGDSLSHARALLPEFLKPERERFRPNPEAVIKAVREQLGLKLEPVRRTIEVLEVRKTEPSPRK